MTCRCSSQPKWLLTHFLAQAIPNPGGTLTKRVTYGYDALDRRFMEKVDTNGDGTVDQTEYFVNDGQRSASNGAGDDLLLTLDGSGSVRSRYLHGAAVDEILAEETVGSSGTDLLWTLTDQQGSVRDLLRYTPATTGSNPVAASVAIVDHIFYDAFGNNVAETHAGVDHVYGYTGRQWDSAAVGGVAPGSDSGFGIA